MCGDEFDEDKITVKYMSKYGIPSVRGGSFCQIYLSESNTLTLKQMITGTSNKCYICDELGHYAKQCKLRTKSPPPPQKQPDTKKHTDDNTLPKIDYFYGNNDTYKTNNERSNNHINIVSNTINNGVICDDNRNNTDYNYSSGNNSIPKIFPMTTSKHIHFDIFHQMILDRNYYIKNTNAYKYNPKYRRFYS